MTTRNQWTVGPACILFFAVVSCDADRVDTPERDAGNGGATAVTSGVPGNTDASPRSGAPQGSGGFPGHAVRDAGADARTPSARDAAAADGGNHDGSLDASTGNPDAADVDAHSSAPPRAIGVATGSSHTCALLEDGSVRCWGTNILGELGSGRLGPSTCVLNDVEIPCATRPVAVKGLRGVKQLSLGGYFSCAALGDGTARCWGVNDFGELGIGTNRGPTRCLTDGDAGAPCATEPVAVAGLTGVTAIAASDEAHACALLGNGDVRCWGLNEGQLGTGSSVGPETCSTDQFSFACVTTPAKVTTLSGVKSVDTGTFHTCAVLASGSVQCWGSNLDGELGSGPTKPMYVPIPVTRLTDATAIALGSDYSCAIHQDRTVSCWGSNELGQLGMGTFSGPYTCPITPGSSYGYDCSPLPVAVLGLTDVTAISMFGAHTCALRTDGTVWCWGHNGYGQLGVGTTDGPSSCPLEPGTAACSPAPVRVPDLDHVVAISAGGGHTCAVVADGSVLCWGGNAYGQLGNGTTTDSATPLAVKW